MRGHSASTDRDSRAHGYLIDQFQSGDESSDRCVRGDVTGRTASARTSSERSAGERTGLSHCASLLAVETHDHAAKPFESPGELAHFLARLSTPEWTLRLLDTRYWSRNSRVAR